MGLLDNRAAVVTGGGKRLGKSFALAVAREGADVAIVSRDAVALNQAREEIEAATGQRVLAFSGDVSNAEEVQALGDSVLNAFGQLDILVNNAAGWLEGTFLESDPEDIDRTIDTTIKGPIWLCRRFWRPLRDGDPGHIVNITILGAREGRRNASPVYVAAKFGLAGFTDALRRLAIKDGIRVTEILPGSVASEFPPDASADEVLAQYGNRRVPPADIVDALIFALTRSEAAMIEEIRIPAIGDWFEDWSRY